MVVVEIDRDIKVLTPSFDRVCVSSNSWDSGHTSQKY